MQPLVNRQCANRTTRVPEYRSFPSGQALGIAERWIAIKWSSYENCLSTPYLSFRVSIKIFRTCRRNNVMARRCNLTTDIKRQYKQWPVSRKRRFVSPRYTFRDLPSLRKFDRKIVRSFYNLVCLCVRFGIENTPGPDLFYTGKYTVKSCVFVFVSRKTRSPSNAIFNRYSTTVVIVIHMYGIMTKNINFRVHNSNFVQVL